MKPVFYPYKMKSASAKVLAKAFGAERVKPDGKFQNNYKRPIINWGNSVYPDWRFHDKQIVLNHPRCVGNATNKLSTFVLFKKAGVRHPEWTTDYRVADTWFGNKNDFFEENEKNSPLVVARKTLTGKGGEGIVVYDAAGSIYGKTPFNSFPLYTKYFKKKEEYRVHVVAGKVIDFAMKKQRQGVEPNYQIRNADNGWVFCREGVLLPLVVAEESIKAVAALGLDFGAVDVGYNVAKQEPCVFEVNSAPGIQGQTVDSYEKAFREMLK